VFLVNSRHPLFCATCLWLPKAGLPSSEGTGAICRVPSGYFSQTSWCFYTCPPVSVWGTVYTLGLFPGTSRLHTETNDCVQLPRSVITSRPRNINRVSIDYAFRPRLRGRLTLRGLTWRRKPWTFDGHVSRMPNRYLCQHSHFRYLQVGLRLPFAGLRNAPLPLLLREARRFGACLETRYIFGAGLLD
jgi:hypothetical protein